MTLYRKYRPQTIDELDLESVRNSLSELSLNLENLPHAFLFSGPKGSGKTSAARILAKLANCERPIITEISVEPCNKCDQCVSINNGQSMDVIELDAASNRGIDDIRELKEKIALAPANAKKKVYILDEAHMLTTEAANAFLKTLEEPPDHAMFILATTDPQRLPQTVISRLSQISFRKATNDEIARQLQRVVNGEELNLEEGVVDLVAMSSEGSFREAVKIIELLAVTGKKISVKKVEQFLHNSGIISATEFVEELKSKDSKKLLSKLNDYYEKGGSTKELIDQMIALLRSEMLASENPLEAITLIKLLLNARADLVKTNIDQLPLEIAIIRWCNKKKTFNNPKKKVNSTRISAKTEGSDELNDSSWAKILNSIRQNNASVETLLRAAKPLGIQGDKICVEVHYRFHKERLESDQCRKVFESAVAKELGLKTVRLNCVLTDPPENMKQQNRFDLSKASLTVSNEEDIIQAAKEIFGG